ncbi:hypothetical protein E2C01_027924 [Portunus trituberculatus]|uniref:Uncharacterized protein n=1 Tax=Portunus trituberculatus TaxID=210409 RepID=A0A5B7EJZ2_PORTR|nr:hypothetical protein [Portunus trituberculatus]
MGQVRSSGGGQVEGNQSAMAAAAAEAGSSRGGSAVSLLSLPAWGGGKGGQEIIRLGEKVGRQGSRRGGRERKGRKGWKEGHVTEVGVKEGWLRVGGPGRCHRDKPHQKPLPLPPPPRSHQHHQHHHQHTTYASAPLMQQDSKDNSPRARQHWQGVVQGGKQAKQGRVAGRHTAVKSLPAHPSRPPDGTMCKQGDPLGGRFE